MSKTLLVIEDNEQNMYLMKFLLEKHGLGVIEAFSAADGIDKAVRLKPDGILLDIQLPDMDGYHVARALRSHNELACLPIIAVTSYAMVGDREKALEAGCAGYIEKPINPDIFIDQIMDYLAQGDPAENSADG